jgi:hypothetical protein
VIHLRNARYSKLRAQTVARDHIPRMNSGRP